MWIREYLGSLPPTLTTFVGQSSTAPSAENLTFFRKLVWFFFFYIMNILGWSWNRDEKISQIRPAKTMWIIMKPKSIDWTFLNARWRHSCCKDGYSNLATPRSQCKSRWRPACWPPTIILGSRSMRVHETLKTPRTNGGHFETPKGFILYTEKRILTHQKVAFILKACLWPHYYFIHVKPFLKL